MVCPSNRSLPRKINVKVSVKPSFILYMLSISLFSGYEACIGLLTALLVHEAGHAVVAFIIKEPVERIELAPFGGVMQYRAGESPSKGMRGMLIASAGPLANYTIILVISRSFCHAESILTRKVFHANLSMMLINAVPALPLDGGAFVFSIGYYLFNLSKLINLLCFFGVALGISLCFLAGVGFVLYNILNISLIIVGVYLIRCARRSRNDMMAQNLYALIYETKASSSRQRKAEIYIMTGNEKLYSLAGLLGKAKAPLFLIEQEGRAPFMIQDTTILQALLDEPFQALNDLREKLIKSERKSE